MSARVKTSVLGLLTVIFLGTLVACATTASMPAKHPMEVEGMPVCSDCHNDWRGNLDHRQDYIHRHGLYARQQERTCSLCHVRSFCADCHADKQELKPSDMYKDEPQRALPHRGDYITQHKIDGKLNPASCFPCHGRQNNEKCKECHK